MFGAVRRHPARTAAKDAESEYGEYEKIFHAGLTPELSRLGRVSGKVRLE